MLLEREPEARAIARLVADAHGGRGGTVTVSGPAGIGKTALLRTSGDEARRGGARVLTATAGPLEQDLPFEVIRQLVGPALRDLPAGQRADVLGGAAALARSALDPAGPPAAGPVDLAAVMHGLYWLCANLADLRPLVLIVDDLQWADEPSLRFVSYLARRVAEMPIAVLAGYRSGVADGQIGDALAGVRARSLRLAPLSADAVHRLVRDRLGPDAEDAFCRACADATGGNPFLLVEALAEVRSAGVRPVAAEAATVPRLRSDTIASSVLARVRRHGSEAERLAHAVAVLGSTAELRHAARLAGLPAERAAVLAQRLADDHVLAPATPLAFVHPLVQSAVYASVRDLARATWHRRAADLLAADGAPADQLIGHLLATEPNGDAWIVGKLREAASTALGRAAPDTAAACLRRALREPPAAGERLDLLVDLGRALGMANQPDAAAEAFTRAYALTSEKARRTEISLELGGLMAHTGRGAAAVEAFERAASLADPLDEDLAIRTAVSLATGRMAGRRPPREWLPPLDALLARLGPDKPMVKGVLASVAFGAACCGDRTADEVARLAEAATDGVDVSTLGWHHVNLASSALAIADRLPRSLRLLDEGISGAQRRGSAAEFRYLAVLRSHTALYAGRLDDAEADARAALDLSDDGSPHDAPLAAAALVDVLVDRGRLDEAQGVLAAYDIERDLGVSMLLAHIVLLARGRLRLRQGRPADALADLLACGEALAGGGYANPGFAHWRAEAAVAHLRLGDVPAARALAREELRLARAFGAARPIGVALRTSALLLPAESAVPLLVEAVDVLARSAADLERAHASVDLGSALRRAGQTVAAREPLRTGLDLATRCGAGTLAERARQELLVTGARPRRGALTGPDALTPAERRVAALAAAGATNREIAQALFVSRHTVEVHLTNTYRKLGIDSRQKLVEAMAAQQRLTTPSEP